MAKVEEQPNQAELNEEIGDLLGLVGGEGLADPESGDSPTDNSQQDDYNPPQQQAPVAQSPADTMAEMKAKMEEMHRTIIDLRNAQAMPPPAAPAPEALQEFVTEEEFATLSTDRAALNKLLFKVYKSAVEKSVVEGEKVAGTVTQKYLETSKKVSEFYGANPDLVAHNDRVAAMTSKTIVERPELLADYGKLLIEVESRVRKTYNIPKPQGKAPAGSAPRPNLGNRFGQPPRAPSEFDVVAGISSAPRGMTELDRKFNPVKA